MVVVAVCLVVAMLTVTVGFGLIGALAGGIGDAFGNSLARLTSQAPATVPPSGLSLDTPVIDTPLNGGYTTDSSIPIQGNVPASVVGKSGYKVNVYLLADNGSQRKVASVEVGGTTRFITTPVTLTEGANKLVATLAWSSGEGQPSPVVTYILDTKPPKITISSPKHEAKVNSSTVDVSGSTDAGATVAIRNEAAPGGSLNSVTVGADGKYTLTVNVVAGSNTIDVTSTDQAGNSATTSVTVTRSYGQLAAHLAISPSKFHTHTTLKLTTHASSFGGAPLSGASVTFTVAIQGLAPMVSPELTTDSSGTATWQVAVTGATAGTGQASVLVTSSTGDVVTATAAIVTY
jgi:hypothetical protein